MAFTLQEILSPTSIGRIDHFLDDLDGTNPNRSLLYNLEILDQLGDVLKTRNGNEQPHLTASQITQMLNFMATRRAAMPANLSFPTGHKIGRVLWRFRDLDGTPGGRSLHARAIELDAASQFVRVHQLNEQPFLSGAQITAISTFMTTQRQKAITEIIG